MAALRSVGTARRRPLHARMARDLPLAAPPRASSTDRAAPPRAARSLRRAIPPGRTAWWRQACARCSTSIRAFASARALRVESRTCAASSVRLAPVEFIARRRPARARHRSACWPESLAWSSGRVALLVQLSPQRQLPVQRVADQGLQLRNAFAPAAARRICSSRNRSVNPATAGAGGTTTRAKSSVAAQRLFGQRREIGVIGSSSVASRSIRWGGRRKARGHARKSNGRPARLVTGGRVMRGRSTGQEGLDTFHQPGCVFLARWHDSPARWRVPRAAADCGSGSPTRTRRRTPARAPRPAPCGSRSPSPRASRSTLRMRIESTKSTDAHARQPSTGSLVRCRIGLAVAGQVRCIHRALVTQVGAAAARTRVPSGPVPCRQITVVSSSNPPPGGNGIVQVQLAVAAVEIGAPQTRRRSVAGVGGAPSVQAP